MGWLSRLFGGSDPAPVATAPALPAAPTSDDILAALDRVKAETEGRVAPFVAARIRRIDETVRASLADGGSLYAVDADLIETLAPDVILTQDLCPVCAVSSGDVTTACAVPAEVISLDPMTLEDVAASVELLARRLGVAEVGARVAAAMRDG